MYMDCSGNNITQVMYVSRIKIVNHREAIWNNLYIGHDVVMTETSIERHLH